MFLMRPGARPGRAGRRAAWGGEYGYYAYDPYEVPIMFSPSGLHCAALLSCAPVALSLSPAVAYSRKLTRTCNYARVQRDYGIRGRSFLRTTANTTWFVF